MIYVYLLETKIGDILQIRHYSNWWLHYTKNIIIHIGNHEVSNFTTDGCVSNVYDVDVILYTSTATSEVLQLKLQRCVDTLYQW